MTNKERKEKYPIGTKIKYIGRCSSGAKWGDCGKTGKIVGYDDVNDPIIFLPESKHISCYSTEKIPASWQTSWSSIKILPQKNQQMLFDFAY